MRKNLTRFISAMFLTGVIGAASAYATPSTHVWAPSTDIQAFGVAHITSDIYVPVKKLTDVDGDGINDRGGTITNLGLTVGVLPFEKVGLEVGFDHIEGQYPLYLNAKLGIPENAFGDFSPAIAVGGYSIGTKSDVTDYNIYYGKVAKTIGPVGRFSAGYYTGNEDLLGDKNDGVLLTWERTISELSENLWVSVDYMGGDNSFGALSYGFAWKFAPNTSVIFGYVDQIEDDLAADTFTVQVDIDFDVFNK